MPDIDGLAALHARCFVLPRPWSEAEIAGILDARGAFLLRREAGFLIGRVIADEAELLTLAVAPEARRQGIAAALLREFAATARDRGAAGAFLEVASDNAAAHALYAGAGWRECGRRKSYYAPAIDALVMHLALAGDAAHENG